MIIDDIKASSVNAVFKTAFISSAHLGSIGDNSCNITNSELTLMNTSSNIHQMQCCTLVIIIYQTQIT